MHFSHSHHGHHRLPSDLVFPSSAGLGPVLFWRHIALGPPLPPARGRVSLLVRAFSPTVAAVKENLRAQEWAIGLLGRLLAAPNYPASSPPPPISNIFAADADTAVPAAAPPPSLPPRTPTMPAPYQLRETAGETALPTTPAIIAPPSASCNLARNVYVVDK